MNEEKEVYFDQYCKSCKHHSLKESKDPCNDCLAEPGNTNSHKPTLCDWIESLPYSELITGKEEMADV